MKGNGNILITGTAGMVGSHLLAYYKPLVSKEQLIGSYHTPTIAVEDILDECTPVLLDVTDKAAVENLIKTYKPVKIFHLAAQSFPTVSWQKPVETMNINVNGTIHIFQAIISLRETDASYDPVVVVACSSAEYGASLTPENVPVKEEVPLLPLHPYGVSKVGQDLLAFQYFQNFGIKTIRARIFNTTGARKTNDVVSDFAARAMDIKLGKEKHFRVGNLETRRAIMDVRDLVSALALLSEKGKWGEAYNISSDKVYKIGDLIPLIEAEIGMKLIAEVDKSLLRPSDEAVIFGDSSKLKKDTGWKQQYSLKDTIQGILEYLNNKPNHN